MKVKPSRQVQRARSRAGLSNTPQSQRGAAAVFAAVALIAMIISVLLAINIGRLYYAKRDLQKQATLAALAGAAVGSGCSSGGVPNTVSTSGSPLWNAVKAAIAANNGNDNAAAASVMIGINGAPAVQVGWVNDVSGDSIKDDSGKTYPPVAADGARHFVALPDGDSHIKAVRVNLAMAAPTLIGASFFTGARSPLLTASATAEQQALGSFYLGTGIASLTGGALNQLLGALLCKSGDTACQSSIVALSVGSAFDGLANVNISLGQLATAAGISVKDLSDPLALNTKTIILSDLLNNLATGLSGTVSGTVSTLLKNLAAASTSPNSVPLGSLLGLVDNIAAGVPFVDLQSLILALGEAATSGPDGAISPIALPINLVVPSDGSLATGRVFLKVGSPPKFAAGVAAGRGCDASCAKTAEVSLFVRIQAGQALNGLKNLINGLLGGLLNLLGGVLNLGISIVVVPQPINIGVDVNVAQATARLDKLQCPTANTPSPVASLSATAAIASVNLGTFTGNLPPVGTTGIVPPLSSGTSWPLAEVKLDATNVCVGLNLLGICIGVPLNLGSSDLLVSLGLTNLTAGMPGNSFQSLSDITRFTQQPNTAVQPGDPTFYYLADGAPSSPNTSPVNPQTIGSPLALQLKLAVNSQENGKGLLGALLGLTSNLVNGIIGLLQPVLDLLNVTILQLLNGLLQLLGVQLGSATVIMDTVVVPPPQLITTELPAAPGP